MPKANRGYQLRFYEPKGYERRQWVLYWYERGKKRERATGIFDSRALKDAEEWRDAFIQHQERRSGPATPDEMMVSEMLDIYGKEHAPQCVDAARIGHAIDALLPFWKDLPVSAIKGETCRRYERTRKVRRGKNMVKAAPNTTRRELGVLKAAGEYCRVEGRLTIAPAVWLPERGASRDRWLTRKEAAAILRAAYRASMKEENPRKAPLHLCTFILLALYTGHRSAAILSLQWLPNTTGGHIDLERQRIDFNPIAARKTNKRRSHIPIPGPLMVHLRLVRQRTRQYPIEFDGLPVKSCKRSFATACRAAKVEGVTPHVMRHTSCTWFMQRGVSPELAAAWVGMDPETYRRIYMHHHPDYMQDVVASFQKSPSHPPS